MSSIKKNIAYQTAYQILTVILPFITSPYLARVLGAKGLGEYSYAYTVAYYFSLFILLGINNHGTREIAKVKDNLQKRSETFISLYVIQMCAGILVIVVYVITQIVISGENLLAKTQLLYVISAFLDINWFFFGMENFRITVTRSFFVKLLTVSAVFLFVKTADDVVLYAMIMGIGFLLSQLLLWPFAIRELKRVKVNMANIMSNIRPVFMLFIPVVAASVFTYMDKIMLGTMCNIKELGFYDNSEKLITLPTSIITAVGTVMLPRITNMMERKVPDKDVSRLFSISLIGSMVAASALSFGLSAIGPSFAPWFWGEEFVRSGELIRAISPSVFFLTWASVIRTQFLIPNNMDGVFVRATIYGAIINFIVNFILIRNLGAMGAVIGTVIAQFVVAFYQTIKCIGKLPIKRYMVECAPFLIIGIFMFVVINQVAKMSLSGFLLIVLEIISGGVVYVVLSIAYYRVFKKITFLEMVEYLRGARE